MVLKTFFFFFEKEGIFLIFILIFLEKHLKRKLSFFFERLHHLERGLKKKKKKHFLRIVCKEMFYPSVFILWQLYEGEK